MSVNTSAQEENTEIISTAVENEDDEKNLLSGGTGLKLGNSLQNQTISGMNEKGEELGEPESSKQDALEKPEEHDAQEGGAIQAQASIIEYKINYYNRKN